MSGGSIGEAIMPSPPASATAETSSGVATPPIPACWIGTVQPTSSVNAVVSTPALWRDQTVGVRGRVVEGGTGRPLPRVAVSDGHDVTVAGGDGRWPPADPDAAGSGFPPVPHS